MATLCSTEGLYDIQSEAECKDAASVLGLTWKTKFSGPNDFPKCFHAEDGQNKVFFNFSPKPQRDTLNPKYAAICKGNYTS